jgi:hypothetical protein
MLYATFILAIIASILFSIWLYKKEELITNRLLLSFISLGSISMMFFMAAHTGVNIFLYIQSAFHGTFNYNFEAYSNIEFALLFFCIGFYIFQNIKAFATGDKKAAKKILIATVIQLILSGTLIPVNTTSTIPTVLYSVSLIAFGIALYGHKRSTRGV